MADIDVVKKGSSLWLWIILAIVIALALWFMMSGGGSTANGTGSSLAPQHQPLQIEGRSLQYQV